MKDINITEGFRPPNRLNFLRPCKINREGCNNARKSRGLHVRARSKRDFTKNYKHQISVHQANPARVLILGSENLTNVPNFTARHTSTHTFGATLPIELRH